MFMTIVNWLFLGAVYGLIGLFGFKVVLSASEAFRTSQSSSRRLVDSVKRLSKIRRLNKVSVSPVKKDVDGNQYVSFEYDSHTFFISTDPTGTLLSCTGHINNGSVRALHAVYDREQGVFLEKTIADTIVSDESKDIPIINRFLDVVTQHQWIVPVQETNAKKDYQLAAGAVRHVRPLSDYATQKPNASGDMTTLIQIRSILEASDSTLREPFLHLIDTCQRLSEKIEHFDEETKHHFRNIVERDIAETFYAYEEIRQSGRSTLYEKVTQNVHMMQNILDDMLGELERNKWFDLEKSVRIIQEKYR